MPNSANQPTLRDPEAPEPLSSSSSINWSSERLLGFSPMDEVHEEFYAVAQGLLVAGEAGLVAALDACMQHAQKHFGREDEWMRSTSFPARDCHIDEHEAVMKSLREVRAVVADGRAGVALVQDFAAHLFAWFPGHADYLDSTLAAWMSKRIYGGQPVVLRTKPR